MPNSPRSINSLRAKETRRDIRQAAHLRGYDHDWAKLRAHKVRIDPLCEQCLREGKTILAQEVDHIRPISEAPELRLVLSNLMSLCRSHHARKTARKR